mmetsp:Transcript_78267/g.162560  ORF Transcript_78267/g.162560 Transcript_78267/m.162560 type:complete len:612 (-) Transcript_78267:138-1973(-)
MARGAVRAFEVEDDVCFPHNKQEFKEFETFDKALKDAQTTDKETLSKNLNLAAKIAAGFQSSAGRKHAAWRLDLISRDRYAHQESAFYAVDTIMRHAEKIASAEVVAAYEHLFSKAIVPMLRRALRRHNTSNFLGERFMKILHSWKRRSWFLPVLGPAADTILKHAPLVQRPAALDPATLRRLSEPLKKKKVEEDDESEDEEIDQAWEAELEDREQRRKDELLMITRAREPLGDPEVLKQYPATPNFGGTAPRTPAPALTFGAMPMTPAFPQQRGPAAARTPGARGGGAIPQTPANFGAGGQQVPRTPANLGGSAVPQTPANFGGRGVPQTPANLGGRSVPQTPANFGQAVPQTPANLRQAVPQTPMGQRAPQTPMRMPGTPSRLGAAVIGGGGGAVPGTPATAAPPTPKRLGGAAGLGTPGTVPATPMGLATGAPLTPRGAAVPATPRRLGGAAPGATAPTTPGVGAVPGTPGRNQAIPRTPAGLVPATPAGLARGSQAVPFTPGAGMPSTPGAGINRQAMPFTPAGPQGGVPTTPGISKQVPMTPAGPAPLTPANFSVKPLPVGAETPAMPAQQEEPDAKRQRREGAGLWTQAEEEAPTVLPPGVQRQQ